MELVTPAIGLIFWTTIVFILLVILLKTYAWKPILTAVNNRNESIEKALQTAEKAKVEMENLNADNERILAEARMERDGILKEAREIKNNIVNEAKEKAKKEADKILTSSKEQIINEKMKALTELKNTVAEMSIEIAEKVLKSELSNKEKQEELVTNALKETELN
tara:strand:+ start:1939 stop:2433 length:495 start_codon:yes stop_codon:yes gene_type:complete